MRSGVRAHLQISLPEAVGGIAVALVQLRGFGIGLDLHTLANALCKIKNFHNITSLYSNYNWVKCESKTTINHQADDLLSSSVLLYADVKAFYTAGAPKPTICDRRGIFHRL